MIAMSTIISLMRSAEWTYRSTRSLLAHGEASTRRVSDGAVVVDRPVLVLILRVALHVRDAADTGVLRAVGCRADVLRGEANGTGLADTVQGDDLRKVRVRRVACAAEHTAEVRAASDGRETNAEVLALVWYQTLARVEVEHKRYTHNRQRPEG